MLYIDFLNVVLCQSIDIFIEKANKGGVFGIDSVLGVLEAQNRSQEVLEDFSSLEVLSF